MDPNSRSTSLNVRLYASYSTLIRTIFTSWLSAILVCNRNANWLAVARPDFVRTRMLIRRKLARSISNLDALPPINLNWGRHSSLHQVSFSEDIDRFAAD